MKIIVTIPPGDKPSPETIVDELCTNEVLCILRGKAYLYDVAWDKLQLALTLKIPREVICGDVVQFYDPDIGTMIKARITSWAKQCTVDSEGKLSYDQTLTLEREVL